MRSLPLFLFLPVPLVPFVMLGLACSGSEGGAPGPGGGPPGGTSSGGGSSTNTPGPSASAPAPPADRPAPTAVAKTFERAPGTTLVAKLEAQGLDGASDPSFAIVTPPARGKVAWIDATRGELVYRPSSIASGTPDELTFVVRGNGKESAPARVVFALAPIDFTAGLTLIAPTQSWYSYNLAANHNVGGNSSCGATQTLTIASGRLLERAWPCGTLPEIAVAVGAGAFSASTNGGGGSFRRITVERKQLDGRLEYEEQSTDCTSYNPTLNSCSAGLSERTTGALYVGTPPATTTAPVLRPTTCETTAGEPCEGILAATDAEGDALAFEVVTEPANGTANVGAQVAMKTFYYTPKPGFTGTDSFTVVAREQLSPSRKSETATITVIVK